MPDYAAGFRYNMLTPFAMNKNHYVVGLGEILWDKFGETKRLGGAPANFAYHASRFGHEGLVGERHGHFHVVVDHVIRDAVHVPEEVPV